MKQTRVIISIAVAFALVAGSAHAYWTAGGSGTSSTPTATMQTVSVAAFTGGDTPSSYLVPGGPAADVILRVDNPNPVPVQVHGVSANGTITADPGHPACTVTGVTFTAPGAPLSPTVTVPAETTTLVHLPGAASMATSSLSACQGATFHIPVTLTARQ